MDFTVLIVGILSGVGIPLRNKAVTGKLKWKQKSLLLILLNKGTFIHGKIYLKSK